MHLHMFHLLPSVKKTQVVTALMLYPDRGSDRIPGRFSENTLDEYRNVNILVCRFTEQQAVVIMFTLILLVKLI